MHFDINREVEKIEPIAIGGMIRDIMRLRRQFGPGRWRKLKEYNSLIKLAFS